MFRYGRNTVEQVQSEFDAYRVETQKEIGALRARVAELEAALIRKQRTDVSDDLEPPPRLRGSVKDLDASVKSVLLGAPAPTRRSSDAVAVPRKQSPPTMHLSLGESPLDLFLGSPKSSSSPLVNAARASLPPAVRPPPPISVPVDTDHGRRDSVSSDTPPRRLSPTTYPTKLSPLGTSPPTLDFLLGTSPPVAVKAFPECRSSTSDTPKMAKEFGSPPPRNGGTEDAQDVEEPGMLVAGDYGGDNSPDPTISRQWLIVVLLDYFCQQYMVAPYATELAQRLQEHLASMGLLEDVFAQTRRGPMALQKQLYSDNFAAILTNESKAVLVETCFKPSKQPSPFVPVPKHMTDIAVVALGKVNTLGIGTSRYQTQFEHGESLGTGGFGTVYSARDVFDGNAYAIKIIRLKGTNARDHEKVLREVKILSRTDHPNVIRYHQAWIETTPGSPRHLIGAKKRSGDSSDTPYASYSDSSPQYSGPTESSFGSLDSFEDTDGSRGRYAAMQVARAKAGRRGGPLQARLYIQMQLCETTLKHFLDRREAAPSVESPAYFAQIVEGLRYMHKLGFIHRDVKPSNVFITDEGVIKIGDFGLAKSLDAQFEARLDASAGSMQLPSDVEGGATDHTAGVGTQTYASPEQLEGSSCGQASDVYSLGIILLELYHHFSTGMERIVTLINLREKQQLPTAFVERFPKEAELVQELTRTDASARPNCDVICTRIGSRFSAQTVSELQKELTSSHSVIERQKEELQDLQRRLTDSPTSSASLLADPKI